MHTRSGFSLVELSIVLVILGLLTGGILSGQSLIRAAELRSVGNDLTRYTTAVHTFRDKYMALPGDMKNATDFWGEAHATPATCQTTASVGTETCNGNGDGYITLTSPAWTYEKFRAWQHLANAGLMEGNYNGIVFTVAPAVRAGVNVPTSKIDQASSSFRYMGYQPLVNSYDMYEGNYGHVLEYGRPPSTLTESTVYPFLTPEEAWNIDMKLDDGRPGYGNMAVRKPASTYSPGCSTDADPAVAEYSVQNTAKICSIIFKTGV